VHRRITTLKRTGANISQQILKDALAQCDFNSFRNTVGSATVRMFSEGALNARAILSYLRLYRGNCVNNDAVIVYSVWRRRVPVC